MAEDKMSAEELSEIALTIYDAPDDEFSFSCGAAKRLMRHITSLTARAEKAEGEVERLNAERRDKAGGLLQMAIELTTARDALRALRAHTEKATQWRDGAGSHHHPIWRQVADALVDGPRTDAPSYADLKREADRMRAERDEAVEHARGWHSVVEAVSTVLGLPIPEGATAAANIIAAFDAQKAEADRMRGALQQIAAKRRTETECELAAIHASDGGTYYTGQSAGRDECADIAIAALSHQADDAGADDV